MGLFEELLMGADAPIPPIARDAAAPKGAPRRLQLPVFPKTELAPPCLGEDLRLGALIKNYIIICPFPWFRV
jgi:hypothetical protein